VLLVVRVAGPPLQTSQPPFVKDNVLLGYVGDICGQDQTVAVDPNNSNRIVAAAGSWYWYSADGGMTWSGGVLSTLAGDPSLAFDNAGNVFWSYVGQVGSRCGTLVVPYQSLAGLTVSKSVDGGRSWRSVMLTNKTDPIAWSNDKEWIAIDKSQSQFHDRIYVVWNVLLNNTWNAAHVLVEGTFGGVYLSYSDDHGTTFSKPTKLPFGFEMYSLQIAVGPKGEVYLVGSIPYRGLNFLKSTDGGKSFDYMRKISNLVNFPNPLTNTKVRTQNYPFPSLAVDQKNGNIYVAWVDAENGDGDIMLRRSTDGGNSWSSPVRVNDDSLTSHSDQLMPSVAVSPDGVIHVAFVDRRNDPTNTAYDIYYAESDNGGASFGKNVRVTMKSSNPNLLHDSTFIGDYLGISSGNDGTVHVVWGGVGDKSPFRLGGLAIFEATIIHKLGVSSTFTASASTTSGHTTIFPPTSSATSETLPTSASQAAVPSTSYSLEAAIAIMVIAVLSLTQLRRSLRLRRKPLPST